MNDDFYADPDMPDPPTYESSLTQSYGEHRFNPNLFISREELFREIINRHEINLEYANRLQVLQGYKIVFIFDDSGSMNTPLAESPLNKQDTLLKASRWDELQYFAKISVEIATIFDPEGCSIYFLNRKPSPVHNICNESQVSPLFKSKPKGFTPLPRVLDKVLNDITRFVYEKKLLIVIATDGEPTDDKGIEAIEEFKKSLQKRNPRIYTTIVACTDDEQSIGYLNEWDRMLKNLDVIDDFRSEREEVMRKKGNGVRFSFGDYVVKSLIGSIDKSMDYLDEKEKCCNII